MTPRRRRWRAIILALAIAEVAYVVSFETVARSGQLERWLDRRPERFQMRYASVHSWLPFWVRTEGLDLQGQTRLAQWRVQAERASGWISPWALLGRRLRFAALSGDGVTVAVRARVRDPAEAAVRLPRVPPIPAFALDDPVEIQQRPPSKRWSFELPRVVARSVDDVWIEGWRIAGIERAVGGFAIVHGQTAEIFPSRLELRAGASLDVDGEPVASGLDGELALTMSPYAYHEVRGVAALAHLSATLGLSGEVVEGALLGRYLQKVPWLEFDPSPIAFEAELEVVDGIVAAGSRLQTVAARRSLGFFGFQATGDARLLFSITDDAEGALARLVFLFGEYEVGRRGDVAAVRGTGLTVVATTRDLRPGPLGDDGRITLDLGKARLDRVEDLASLVPEAAGVVLRGGSAELDGRLDGDLGTDSGNGRVGVRFRDVRVGYGELDLQGDLDVELALASRELRARRFALAGSRVDLTGFRSVGGSPGSEPTSGWWAHFTLGEARLDLATPVVAEGGFAVALRDSQPLVALYTERRELPRWVERLLEMEDVRARGRFRYERPELRLDDLVTRGEHSALSAWLELGRGQRQGALLLEWRALALGVAVDGEKRDWKLVGAREWFRRGEGGG